MSPSIGTGGQCALKIGNSWHPETGLASSRSRGFRVSRIAKNEVPQRMNRDAMRRPIE